MMQTSSGSDIVSVNMIAAEEAQESRIKADMQELHSSSAPASEDPGLNAGVTCTYALVCCLVALKASPACCSFFSMHLCAVLPL